jgi:hypothetical protein
MRVCATSSNQLAETQPELAAAGANEDNCTLLCANIIPLAKPCSSTNNYYVYVLQNACQVL